MKTKKNSQSESLENKNFEVLSNNEMKELNGGLRMLWIRDEDGNIKVVIIP